MYYPLMIELKDKNIVVIGGGNVAFRKTQKLLEYEANVTVISPQLVEKFNYLKKVYHDKLNIIVDYYNNNYINNPLIVIAATSNRNINEKINLYCKKKNILCNVVDDIEKSDFIVPASLKRGDLVISVSTMGKSPLLSVKIKKELEEKYEDTYEEYVFLLGEARDIILTKFNNENKKDLLKSLINMSVNELRKFIKDNI